VSTVQGWISSPSGSATFPNTPTVGNLLALAVASDSPVTTPSGWTASASLVNVIGLYLFTKTAGSSEPSTVTVTLPGAGAVAIAELSAVDSIENLTGTVTRSTGSAPVSVALTDVVTAAGDYVIAVAGSISTSLIQWDGWTGDFTEQVDTTTTNSGNKLSLAVADHTLTGLQAWSTSVVTANRVDDTVTAAPAQALIVAVKADPDSATIRPGRVTGNASVGDPTVVIPIPATATPAVVAAAATVDQVVVVTPGHTIVPPATVAAVANVGAIVSAVTSSTISVDTVTAAADIPPVTQAGTVGLTTVRPTVVAGSAAVGTVAVTTTSATDATATPATTRAVAVVAAPVVSAGHSTTIQPAAVTCVATAPTPSITAGDVTVAALLCETTANVGAITILSIVPTYKFVPPTAYTTPVVLPGRHPMNALMRHYAALETGQSVWVLKTGEITMQQPIYWEDVDHVFYGGHEYIVDSDEAARLEAAGFRVEAAA
jgi:hypothetical protein